MPYILILLMKMQTLIYGFICIYVEKDLNLLVTWTSAIRAPSIPIDAMIPYTEPLEDLLEMAY